MDPVGCRQNFPRGLVPEVPSAFVAFDHPSGIREVVDRCVTPIESVVILFFWRNYCRFVTHPERFHLVPSCVSATFGARNILSPNTSGRRFLVSCHDAGPATFDTCSDQAFRLDDRAITHMLKVRAKTYWFAGAILTSPIIAADERVPSFLKDSEQFDCRVIAHH